ncbi:carbonic anhydrase [Shouchella clausii]|uniref:carbonic anhydrase n=1 Tax=Shouchella clausii TaxID=79880 RepID=UPI000B96468D|nr:carbonic anhydrase family protein [Shouchella clausii]AST96614.1 hypothetical protein BC8716_11900 [Shouchella clausii]MCR1288293.1 carbonic anhydrase family protein [Shouchella clausii]MCY1105484.1 carbonic anhydrase family protein [Shouchella clausii]MEB5471214.1 carbonic anhydrase family protein [Shouchella clausii]MED4159074.1 carbonic anhydrase family protein [Shouchella clausii]
MKRNHLFTSITLASVVTLATAPAASAASFLSPLQALKASWSYEGDTGPEFWGDLDEAFAACSNGKEQSPINLFYDREQTPKWNWAFSYSEAAFSVENNGHTIQANVENEDAGGLEINGEAYQLTQFHFHTPSEHTIEETSFPMELHLVHANHAGDLAVLGVLMEIGNDHEGIEAVWEVMPEEEGTAEYSISIDPSLFLPESVTAYQYDGSLTTPPCSEGVKWTVLNDTISISATQLDAFRAIYPQNYRPVQELGDREIGFHYH